MFHKIVVESWNDALLLFDKITNEVPDWAFRGQADASWDLTTKFEREAKKYQHDSYWFNNREFIILKDFQRRAHQYVQNLPDIGRYIEWLSLLQHYGGPTRLLDFTYSCYVAAFFALETAEKDSAIWAVNVRKLKQQITKLADFEIKEQNYLELIEEYNIAAEAIIKKRKKTDIVLLVEPFHQHERISIQQGLFLFPGNIEQTFEYNICSLFEFDFRDLSNKNAVNMNLSDIEKVDFSNVSIVKIIFPPNLRAQIHMELNKMNITSTTLFPGFEGFARSLSFRFSQLDYFVNRQKL
jgi:hypothetical protein